jgi:hypothetical protein
MKKGQVELLENSFVVIMIYFIAFIMIGGFLANEFFGQKKMLADLQEKEWVRKVNLIYSMQEFRCNDNSIQLYDCFDKDKIEAFIDLSTSDDAFFAYYREMMGEMVVKVSVFDYAPDVDDYDTSMDYVVYEIGNPKSETYREIKFPIILRDRAKGTNHFAILKIGAYQ